MAHFNVMFGPALGILITIPLVLLLSFGNPGAHDKRQGNPGRPGRVSRYGRERLSYLGRFNSDKPDCRDDAPERNHEPGSESHSNLLRRLR